MYLVNSLVPSYVLLRDHVYVQSSEDDGQGGRQRRKKSIKEKIKEKLPGSNNSNKQEEHKGAGHAVPAAAGTGTHAAATHEKKGIMQKIKEKLPGHH